MKKLFCTLFGHDLTSSGHAIQCSRCAASIGFADFDRTLLTLVPGEWSPETVIELPSAQASAFWYAWQLGVVNRWYKVWRSQKGSHPVRIPH